MKNGRILVELGNLIVYETFEMGFLFMSRKPSIYWRNSKYALEGGPYDTVAAALMHYSSVLLEYKSKLKTSEQRQLVVAEYNQALDNIPRPPSTPNVINVDFRAKRRLPV